MNDSKWTRPTPWSPPRKQLPRLLSKLLMRV